MAFSRRGDGAETYFIDVFVGFDQVNRELPQRGQSWVTETLGHVPLE